MALLSSRSGKGAVSTGEVARYLGVAPASATEMLTKLARGGLVQISPYHGASLTPEGVRDAQRVTRKHRLLERFLSDVLLIPLDRVHAQACEMEHSLSDEAEESLCRLLRHPDRCPDDGQVIPACELPYGDCDHCMRTDRNDEHLSVDRRQSALTPVSSLGPGGRGKISFIRSDGESLRSLGSRGVKPGVTVETEVRLPSGGVKLAIGGASLELGGEAAASVFVEKGEG